jgi:hypothetical protein
MTREQEYVLGAMADECRERIAVYWEFHRYDGPCGAYDRIVRGRAGYSRKATVFSVDRPFELRDKVRLYRLLGVDCIPFLRAKFKARQIMISKFYVFADPFEARRRALRVCSAARLGGQPIRD